MIVYVGNIVSGHGKTATTIETLGKLLQEDGFEVRLTSNKKNKILRMFDMLWTVFKYRKKVTTVLIDTYSTSNFYYAYLVSKLCILLKIKYIPILHGGNLEERLKNSKSKSDTIFKNAKVNVCPSLFLKTTFSNYGYTNLVHIPNNLELDQYPFKNRENVKAKLLWVRSFAEIYNPQLAVRVVHSLKAKGIEASLCMVGPEKDASFQKTKQLASELNVEVTFTGKLSKHDWVSLSAEYDIFINTTNFDNTPISLIEAMALGMPIVSTNVGGIPYLIEDQKDGLLVKQNSVDEMVNAIENLVKSPELVQKITQNAKNKATQFDWEVVKLQWKALLSDS
ncbi:glycosyltransferase family 4 protein [Kordia sp. YSTF-M3]|uniref:Glycosyltransferase family 4 protein n=1 Tax=Kordia aestuariivivens TaxID=2759037 RepID=A0ABR7Q9V9_9FLAO|nr:glycosyltransferase family 4 protein [Kordia aestuariivivens]MBC8755119.1 glycosyltransferase family 4 protein [Kordia aestuariivivens]